MDKINERLQARAPQCILDELSKCSCSVLQTFSLVPNGQAIFLNTKLQFTTKFTYLKF